MQDAMFHYPLRQHIGAASIPVVAAGDPVSRGGLLARRPEGSLGVNLFSSVSGTVAAVTSILTQLRVNVANMSLYRHKRGGDALMVIETDQHLKPSQVSFLSELPGILSITYYDKEEDEDVSGFDEGNL